MRQLAFCCKVMILSETNLVAKAGPKVSFSTMCSTEADSVPVHMIHFLIIRSW